MPVNDSTGVARTCALIFCQMNEANADQHRDAAGKLHRWTIEDHHPESSWATYFGKIWYEGATGPAYVWQSSAGSDEFEAKYSLVPLFYGTVKGTFYALLFALPIALTAAVYVSQFLRPEFRQVVKPGMEIMASLPSVVLGFLAGLWLARNPGLAIGVVSAGGAAGISLVPFLARNIVLVEG